MPHLFPALFSPLSIGHVTLKNRISFGTHTPNMGIGGRLRDRHFYYYLERARGGAAMISVEPLPAHSAAVLTRGQFKLADETMVPYFRRLTDAIHAEGTVIAQQIFHTGPHCDGDNSWTPNWSAGETLSSKDGSRSHAMTAGEIDETIAGFVFAAAMVRESGYDGVEINAGFDSLIPSFWSPRTNWRDDAWGGTFEKRMRFSVAVLDGIRKRVGDRFLIGMTMTGNDNTPGGQGLEERKEIAAYLDARGLVDYIAVKTGSYFDWARVMPSFMYEPMQGAALAAGIKSAVRYAKVQAESLIRTPENAERVIADGMADIVSLVRAQIADPRLANKARAGRPQEIRPCISCNQLCVGRRFRDYWFSCLVNPAVGREYEWGSEDPQRAASSKRILIVGAGPAGLETARVAAHRGHRVTLVDRDDRIGGQFRLAATQPRRGEIAQLLYWYYQGQIDRLGIDLRLGISFDVEDVERERPDVVVIATGSRPPMTGEQRALPSMRLLPGVGLPSVFSINDVLRGSDKLGWRVLLLDDLNGWMPASGTAIYLSQRGHAVTLMTASAAPLMALGTSTADAPIREMFATQAVATITTAALVAWSAASARFRDLRDGSEWEQSFDSLVLATANEPEDALSVRLRGLKIPVHKIGDCVAPRTAAMAFYDGRRLGLSL